MTSGSTGKAIIVASGLSGSGNGILARDGDGESGADACTAAQRYQ
jgi:hypothetical protein